MRPTLGKMMNVVNTKIGKYIDEHLLVGYKKARDGITHGLKRVANLKMEKINFPQIQQLVFYKHTHYC